MTFRHRAGVSPYTSSFDLAETCVFGKQSLGPIRCGPPSGGLPLFQSYGVNLPSSLTTLLPLALGFSPHLPVSVCGTGTSDVPHTFSRHRPSRTSLLMFGPFRPGLPTPGSGYLHVSVYLTASAATEFQPYVHRLRLSASP